MKTSTSLMHPGRPAAVAPPARPIVTPVPVFAAGTGSKIIPGLVHPLLLTLFLLLTAALKLNAAGGTVLAWGDPANGATTVPAGLSGVIAVGGGDGGFSVALKSDGTVVAWGNNTAQERNIPAGLSGVTAISSGGGHTVALKSDGTVAAWGYDGSSEVTGKIPTGAPNSASVLSVRVDGTLTGIPISGVIAVSAGGNHSLALKSDGTVKGWGFMYAYGVPGGPGSVAIPALNDVIAVAAGSEHSLYLRSNGEVVAMGWPNSGSCTVPVAAQSGVIAIAAGQHTSTALKSDGTVVQWGNNGNGKATPPPGLSGVVAIATPPHGLFSMALKSDGTVVMWGLNTSGQTTLPGGLANVLAIGAGNSHALAVVNAGTPQTITFGPLGTRATNFDLTATASSGLPVSYASSDTGVATVSGTRVTITGIGTTTITASQAGGGVYLAAPDVAQTLTVVATFPTIQVHPVSLALNQGQNATFSVTAAGEPLTYFWLSNEVYNGLGTPVLNLGPAQISQAGSYSVIVSNSSGSVTSLVATLSVTPLLGRTVVAWGRNQIGQTNVPADLTNAIAISAASSFSIALRSDGTVVGWGNNTAQERNIPAGLSGVTAIASGGSHTVALKSDGTVAAWGYNGSGEVTGTPGVPANATTTILVNLAGFGLDVSGVIAVAAGGNHSMALKNNGTIVGWGYLYTQVPNTVGMPAGGVTAIAAGSEHSMALVGDRAYAWGNNNSGCTTVPVSAQSGVVAIAAGNNNSTALKSDGTVVQWGNTANGKSTPPPGLSGVAAIATPPHGQFSMALLSNTTVVAWGLNTSGQTNAPPGLSNVTAIATGSEHALAIYTDIPPVLRITTVGYDALNDQLNLTWNSIPGSLYTIELTQEFGNPTVWDNLTTGIVSGGATTTRMIDFPTPGTFYRIRKQ